MNSVSKVNSITRIPLAKRLIAIALFATLALSAVGSANEIARFADPLPQGGGAWMFMYINGGYGLYAGWQGPPYITLETPQGTISGVTMHAYPMYYHPNGVVGGGQFTFYDPNQAPVLQITFTNGYCDMSGLRCGPQTGGTVQFTYYAGGVQLPAGLTEPLQGAWISFEFHNYRMGTRGPEWTASFTSGANGQKGDLTCDGAVNFIDINPFVQALSDPAGYAVAHPWCDINNGDINGDGRVDFTDINAFVAKLTGAA